MLEHHPESPFSRSQLRQVYAVEQDATGVRLLKSRKQPEHGRLAASARSKQSENFTSGDIQGNVVGGHMVSEPFRESVDL